MEKLVKGIHQFQEKYFAPQRKVFEQLATGQTPEVLFITCSDSRVSPNMVTQSALGELFILRNAGNIVPPYGSGSWGEAATIEYAICALKIRHIIVCGHSSCGAMQALTRPETLENLPAVAKWLEYADATRRIVQSNYGDRDVAVQAKIAIEENVLVQLQNLRTHPAVAQQCAKGNLFLYGWVYKLETGEVFGFDPALGQFVPLISQDSLRSTGNQLLVRKEEEV